MRHVLLLGEWTPKLSRRYVRKQSPWLADSTYFEPIEIMAPFKFLSWGKWKWWPARHDVNFHIFVSEYNNTLNLAKCVEHYVYKHFYFIFNPLSCWRDEISFEGDGIWQIRSMRTDYFPYKSIFPPCAWEQRQLWRHGFGDWRDWVNNQFSSSYLSP
jgi:hypothetical protein